MITLQVSVEGVNMAAELSGLAEQVPYALSRAINFTVNSAQQAVQAALPQEFTLRRADFIARTIYRDPRSDFATKASLSGAVRVNPGRDVLAKFELGGTKTPTRARSLAVPIVRLDAPALIIRPGSPLSPGTLMQAIKQRGGKTRRLRKGELAAVLGNSASRVFLAKTDKGTFLIQRVAPGHDGTRVLYWFRPSVPIPATLNFDTIAEGAALLAWPQNVDLAIADAIATMR